MPTGVNRPAKEKRTGRRKHSFGGCRTCRRRHVRCDQIRPACLACRAINAICEGYASDVRWMPPSTLSSAKNGQFEVDDGSKTTIRHHLYSEASRASMSRAITCTDVDRSLAEVDARTQGLEESGSGDIAVGPFGVLKIDAAPRETPSPHDSVLGPCQSAMVDPRPNEDMPSFEVPNNDIAISNETQTVPSVVDWFDPILGFNNTLHWADLFGLDFDSGNSLIMPQQPLIQPDFYLDNFLPESIPEQPPVSLPIHSQQPPEDPPLYTAEGLPQTEAVTIVEQEERYSIILSEVKSATEAQFLLKHFHDAVIHQMSFMPSGSKSPWTILQLPEAMRSLSELTYLHSGQLKHANMANLYGLMACSAYHLAATHTTLSDESPEYWMDLLERLKAKAKLHMQISLRDELKGDRKAKYKDQLMAILSMLALTSISGHQRDARFYMIDAERLLRIKGLAKRDISRKCRLLHHVYTWIRIVGESTYVIHEYPSFGPVVDNMSAAHKAGRLHGTREKQSSHSRSGHNARLDDFIRLEPHSSDSDLAIDELKENEGGLVDIHLEDSRLYSNTLYHIYGISETWLSLVSQTTRLANILDAAKYGKNTDVSFMNFLQKRAGRLENIVCSFALKDPSSDDEDSTGSVPAQNSPNNHMLRAMNSALVIIFYRRIRNVNPLILQGHVDSVVNSLRDFDTSLASHGIQGPGSAWPAFIAGCEALSRRNRKFLMGWLEKGFEKCGLEYFNVSRRLMKEVWERQDEPTPLLDPGSGGSGQSKSHKSSSYHRTWVDVSREKSEWVMLF